MWIKLAHFILKFRVVLISTLVLLTAFMAYQIKDLAWKYTLMSVVPKEDPQMLVFQKFKEQFGEDGNVMAMGMKDAHINELKNFNLLKKATGEIRNLKGIKTVLAQPSMVRLKKNTTRQLFEVQKIFPDEITSQATLDSLLSIANHSNLKNSFPFNNEGASVIFIVLEKNLLNSKERTAQITEIERIGQDFENATGIEIHYAGLPYVRSVTAVNVRSEMILFLFLSVIITGLILFFFFRSLKAVMVPLIIIGTVITWTLGTMVLFDFEITILSGLIPPILVVIGIPNCVYMLNQYHQEFLKRTNQKEALAFIISKIGVVLLATNVTTAIGFFVLTSTSIEILYEFGLVAGINIMGTFIVSIIVIPSVFSIFPPPSPKHLKHLRFQYIITMLKWINSMVQTKRKIIFLTTFLLIIVSLFGMSRVYVDSFISDDFPKNSILRRDLIFFEENFGGIMPFEIIVDTGVKEGVKNLENLKKIEKIEKAIIKDNPYASKAVSLVGFFKSARQAFYGDNEAFYSLPTNRDKAFILKYLDNSFLEEGKNDLVHSFTDSTGRYVRISQYVADIGSQKLDSLVHGELEPRIDNILQDSKMKVSITGTTLMFVKGNDFLISNLLISMIIAFTIIAIIMGGLFKNPRMILISILPNIIPLIMTAALMGYFNIPLKPSTVLTFSIVFGISVDDSIHFLSKYRQELFSGLSSIEAVKKAIEETGLSMIYTSIILFFGFVIFIASDFGGTVALGKLISFTLFVAMITNLLLLPALILSFTKKR